MGLDNGKAIYRYNFFLIKKCIFSLKTLILSKPLNIRLSYIILLDNFMIILHNQCKFFKLNYYYYGENINGKN